MKTKLRTQCPTCHTTFALSQAELDAGAGLVRCGHCSVVFQAEKHLLMPVDEERQSRRSKAKPRVHKRRHSDKAKRPKKTEIKHDNVSSANAGADTSPEEFVSDELARVLGERRHTPTRSVLWGLGALLLLAALLGQLVFFYGSELARYPQLKAWVLASCEWLHCEIRPRQNVELIELLRTSVAPHPKEAKVLRIRASMVNRAEFTQPYPAMEITLTDTAGAVVARRTFAPRHYLSKKPAASTGMVPHVVIDALLDISNPDPNPGGYEIRLLPR